MKSTAVLILVLSSLFACMCVSARDQHEAFSLKGTYKNAAELQSYLKKYSTWPFSLYQHRQKDIYFYITANYPFFKSSSYVLATVDKTSKEVTVVDNGYYWRTSKNTNLGQVRYDYKTQTVYYLDHYNAILGSKKIDLGIMPSTSSRSMPSMSE